MKAKKLYRAVKIQNTLLLFQLNPRLPLISLGTHTGWCRGKFEVNLDIVSMFAVIHPALFIRISLHNFSLKISTYYLSDDNKDWVFLGQKPKAQSTFMRTYVFSIIYPTPNLLYAAVKKKLFLNHLSSTTKYLFTSWYVGTELCLKENHQLLPYTKGEYL